MVPTNLKNDKEIFVEIKGSNKGYYVSNLGRIYSTPGNSNANKKGKFLSFGLRGKGYYGTVLRKMSINSISVHRVVAEHFILNPMNLPEVNHINGDKLDNRVENLEWVSSSSNMKHSYKLNPNRITDNLRNKARLLAKNLGLSKRKLTMKDAKKIREEHKGRGSTKILSKKYNVGMHVIRRIVRGETYNE